MSQNCNKDFGGETHVDPEICFINRKGGTVLLYGACQFYKVKTFKNGMVLWRCSQYKKNKCSGNIIMQDNIVVKQKHHICTQNLAKNIVDKEFIKLRENVINSIDPVPKLYYETRSKIEELTFDLAIDVPSLSNVQRNLYKLRNQSLGVNKTVFKRFEEVEVPLKFHDLILADYYYEGARIILFCSLANRKKIGEIKEYFGDATFSSCPEPFSQLHIIHGDIGSTSTKTRTAPLIYTLMPNKKQATYAIIFELIKRELPNFNPDKYHCDFEKGAINAFSEVFPQTKLTGCYYHWSRAIWKRAKNLKLNGKKERRLVGLTAVLPLLPAENMTEGLNYIKSEGSNNDKMIPFFKYLDGFWMTKQFDSVLSVFGERHRTNNVTESFHSKLNKTVKKTSTTILRLLTELKSLESRPSNKRKTKYVTDDDDIREIQLKLLNKEISVGLALEKLR